MAMTPDQRRQRARIAAQTRHSPDDPELVDARRDLRAERLADHVREVVNQAPPLSESQRARIAAALWFPSADGADCSPGRSDPGAAFPG